MNFMKMLGKKRGFDEHGLWRTEDNEHVLSGDVLKGQYFVSEVNFLLKLTFMMNRILWAIHETFSWLSTDISLGVLWNFLWA